jgi:hypothetical protein
MKPQRQNDSWICIWNRSAYELRRYEIERKKDVGGRMSLAEKDPCSPLSPHAPDQLFKELSEVSNDGEERKKTDADEPARCPASAVL